MDLFYLNINNLDFGTSNNYLRCHNAGRYLLNYAAENFYNIKNTEIEIVNKKPKFKYSNLEFSISHSKDIAAVCFDKNPLGFDIEKILPRSYKEIAKRMNFIMEKETSEEFYKCWTLYEAKIKLQANHITHSAAGKIPAAECSINYCLSQKLNDSYMFSVVSLRDFKIEQIKEIN